MDENHLTDENISLFKRNGNPISLIVESKEKKKKKTESTTVSDSYMNTWCKLSYVIIDTKITPKVYQ